MKVIVVPGSAQTSRSAIRTLLNDPLSPAVVGVYRNLDKVPAEFKKHMRFQAVQGDVSDGASLDFSGCDAVITMTPPKLDGSDFIAFGKKMANNGEVRTNHNCERILEGLDCDVILVRNCFFMENWSSALETIRADPPYFYSTIAPLDYSLPMASARDIGRCCAREALGIGAPLQKSPRIVYLHGPRNFSVHDVHEAWEKVTGKKIEVKLIEKDDLRSFFEHSPLPDNLVDDFVEMTLTFLPGGLLEKEMNDLTNAIRGQDTLVDAFTQMWKENEGTSKESLEQGVAEHVPIQDLLLQKETLGYINKTMA